MWHSPFAALVHLLAPWISSVFQAILNLWVREWEAIFQAFIAWKCCTSPLRRLCVTERVTQGVRQASVSKKSMHDALVFSERVTEAALTLLEPDAGHLLDWIHEHSKM